MLIHIQIDPWGLASPVACGGGCTDDQQVSASMASTVVEHGVAKLSRITVDQLCPTCLEIMQPLLYEIQTARRDEEREAAATAANDLAGIWPQMPDLSDGVDRFAQYPVVGEP